MAEDDSEDGQKTEDPTPRRLEEAHKRGQVVHSREVNNWFVLFASTLVIVMAGPGIMSDMSELFKGLLEQSYAVPTDAAGLGAAVRDVAGRVFSNLLLPLLAISCAGALSGFIQTGPLFTFEPISPDLSRISPLKGFGRLFSKRAVVEFLKGIAKLVLVGIAIYIVLRPHFDNVDHFIGLEPSQSLLEMRMLFLKMMIGALAVLSVLAIFDYVFQRSEFMKQMRMSKQEIKEEYKQTEGDPMVKGKLRQLREQKARQRMMQAVPTADVVITNPTHYAVALKYDTAAMDAPMMVAKGVDAVAERIKALAKENDVPVIENPALARALYSSMEIDQVIPRDHYKAVAEVISYVFRLKGKKA